MNSPVLAIDFGTTRTKVAYFDEHRGEPRLVELGRENRAVIPSVFYVPKEGETVLVGDDAQEMADTDPEGIVIGLKRELHKRGKIRLGPGRLAIERDRLASELFLYIRQRSQEEVLHGDEITACRLTVPSAFGEPQREAIRRAAQLGGFRDIAMIDESVAAAQSWLADAGERIADSVLVCDIGGGTTDFALVRIINGRFQTHTQVLPSGLELGGNDMDKNIWEQLLARQKGDVHGLERLSSGFLIKLRRIRECLGRDRRREIAATLEKETLKIQRDIVENGVAEFVERVAEETRRFAKRCAEAGVARVPLLIAGGGSRLPGIKQALEHLNLGPVFLWNNAEFSTVLGAVAVPAEDALSQDKTGPLKGDLRSKEDLLQQTATLVSDGHAEEAFSELTAGLQKEPTLRLFVAWFDCALLQVKSDCLLRSARSICQSRQEDPWGKACLISALFAAGRRVEALEEFERMQGSGDLATPVKIVAWFYVDSCDMNRLPLELQEGTADAEMRDWSVVTAHRALFELDAGNQDGYNRLVGQALRSNKNCMETLVAKAIADILRGEGTAEMEMARLRQIAAGHWATSALGALSESRKGRWESAERFAVEALKVPASHSNASLASLLMLVKGKAKLNSNRIAEAKPDFEEALLLWSMNVFALHDLLAVYMQEQDLPSAFLIASRLLFLRPDNFDASLARGWLLSNAFQFKAALADFECALSMDPSHLDAQRGLVSSTIHELRFSLNVQFDAPPTGTCFAAPHIPEHKLHGAQSHLAMHGTTPEAVLMLWDSTFFGGGEDGMWLTHNLFIWHKANEGLPYRCEYEKIKSVHCQSGTLTVDNQAVCDFENDGRLYFVAECLRRLSARFQRSAVGGRDRQSGGWDALYQGTCVNTTSAQKGSLSLCLRLQDGGCFEGHLSIYGLSGGGAVQGKVEGDLIRFQSTERACYDWNGKVNGDRLDGEYAVQGQKGKWSLMRCFGSLDANTRLDQPTRCGRAAKPPRPKVALRQLWVEVIRRLPARIDSH